MRSSLQAVVGPISVDLRERSVGWVIQGPNIVVSPRWRSDSVGVLLEIFGGTADVNWHRGRRNGQYPPQTPSPRVPSNGVSS